MVLGCFPGGSNFCEASVILLRKPCEILGGIAVLILHLDVLLHPVIALLFRVFIFFTFVGSMVLLIFGF
jgi:hypothetical protein